MSAISMFFLALIMSNHNMNHEWFIPIGSVHAKGFHQERSRARLMFFRSSKGSNKGGNVIHLRILMIILFEHLRIWMIILFEELTPYISLHVEEMLKRNQNLVHIMAGLLLLNHQIKKNKNNLMWVIPNAMFTI
jgi:hypothetical protein